MKTRNLSNGAALHTVQILVILAIALVLTFAIINIGRESTESGRLQLEKAVRRSVVACYAAEGIYPDSIEYLKEHYGLHTDDTRYSVHYLAFADNLMPDITVTRKK